MKLFTPTYYVKSVFEIRPSTLSSLGAKAVIYDLDNVLASTDELQPSIEIKNYISLIKKTGIKIMIVSNNSNKRVSKFCKNIEVPYSGFSMKPLKFSFKRVKKELGLKLADKVVMVGDQLLSDIAFANRNKIISFLVKPINEDSDAKITKFNRKIENSIYKKLERLNILKKNKFGKIKK